MQGQSPLTGAFYCLLTACLKANSLQASTNHIGVIEMNKPFDLNNPPAGATHWDADPARTPSFMLWTGEQRYFWPPTSDKPEWCRWNREGRESTFHILPLVETVPTWNGPEDGLPPVGLEIEVLWSSACGSYVKAKVVAHDQERAVFRFTSGEREGEYQVERNTTFNGGALPNFRPICTAEQLAAEAHRAKYMPQLIKLWDADTQRAEFLEAVYALIVEAGKS